MLYIGKECAYQNLLGTIVENSNGTVVFETPHGSKLTMGFAWFARWCSEFTSEQYNQFIEYKKDAAWQNTNDKNGDA